MKAKLCCFVILGAIIFGICNAAPHKHTSSKKARQFAEAASENLFEMQDRYSNAFSNEINDLTDTHNALTEFFDFANLIYEVFQNASRLAQTKYKDEEINFILNKLKNIGDIFILEPDQIWEILTAQEELKALATDKNILDFFDKDYDNLKSYFPEIQKIFATSDEPITMKYYWNAWRYINGVYALDKFLFVVNGIKDAANETGISPYEFWMKDFNMTQMDAVMTQIEPIYQQIHGFLRHQLNKKYGYAVIDTKGLIPDHLFQQLLAQVWTNGSVIDEYFPYKDLPAYSEALAKKNFDTLKLYKMADQFYESMGLKTVTEDDWETIMTDEGKDDCKAITPNASMQNCHETDFRAFLKAHSFMAEVHFAHENPDLPFYYFSFYNLEYAVGEAAILSASSPKYLSKAGIITESEFSDEVFMNRLMRLAIHTMLNIPVYYVHTKLMADLLSEKVEPTELNKHYWGLMDKYVGVGPPGDRENNSFDLPPKFYLELNQNKQARKFNSEILSYQFYKKLCSIAGQYPNGKLQNCDFSDSKEAGDALKKMIILGSSKPINEVLATLLPEDPKMNAVDLLEYYLPAFTWLNSTNQQNKVNIGWTHSDKKIDSVVLD